MPEFRTLTVAIPVGPNRHHCEFLQETLESVAAQTVPPQVLIVDDMHGIAHPFDDPAPACSVLHYLPEQHKQFVRDNVEVYRAPWRLGIPCAFNFGVALAHTELVLMLGADDTLEPDAVERILEDVNADGAFTTTYYGLPLRYMDTGEEQYVACNMAVVSKTFWRLTGGFPPESAVGACDAAFLSSIWNSDTFRIRIVGDKPLANYRRHSATDTATRPVAWQGPILAVRDLLTPLASPDWGRYS